MNVSDKTNEELIKIISDLQSRLSEAEDTIEAIRTGAVDALAIHSPEGPKIYTLENADRTYRTLIETMNEGAVLLNRDGVILYGNSQFASMVNIPLSSVIGSVFFNFLPIDTIESFSSLFIKAWEMPIRDEFILNSLRNKSKYVQLSFNKIDLKDEVALGLVITDLTPIRQAHQDLQVMQQDLQLLNSSLEQRVVERTDDLIKAKKELESSYQQLTNKNKELLKTNSDLDNFVYTASHDLKAPISNIEGLISALKKEIPKESSPKGAFIIDMMSSSVQRLKDTIFDLTEITKVQKESSEDVAEINCEEVIQDVIASINNLIEVNNAKIRVICNTNIKFSRKNLKSIFYNLISNAIKYKNPGMLPEVVVKTEKLNDRVFITVKDNGLGIPEHNKEKVFSMFKRLHNHVEGSGVGLYLVKRIVDNAGGTIELESEVNKGSTFKITIPE